VGSGLRSLLPAVAGTLSRETECLPLLPHPTHLVMEEGEAQYFDFFRHIVTPQLAYEADGPPLFWLETVMRESVLDKCVLHAIIAIGALYRSMSYSPADVPLYRTPLMSDNPGSLHYRKAVQYYSKALENFTPYMTCAQEKLGRRKVLISTMLVTVFELLQGNIDAVDRIAAVCITVLGDNLLRTNNTNYASHVAASLDDGGLEDAELWLTRRATLSAISSPIYPRARESVLFLAGKSTLGPGPVEGSDSLAYFRCWCQFFNPCILWYLQTQQMIMTGLYNQRVGVITEEKNRLLRRLASWDMATTARLNRSENPIDLVSNQTFLLGAKILAYCIKWCLDEPDASRALYKKEWEDIEVLSLSIRDCVNQSPTKFGGIRDALLFGLLQIARDCRSSDIQMRAIDLCRSIVNSHLRSDMVSFVMGTYAVVSVEATHCNEQGFVPSIFKYDWMSSSWNQSHTKLHVKLKSRYPIFGELVHKELEIDQYDWGMTASASG
jgi:hypothetical protein